MIVQRRNGRWLLCLYTLKVWAVLHGGALEVCWKGHKLVTNFEHHLQTGSGWTKVSLTIEDETATVEFDSRWMGTLPLRYRFQCLHTRISDLLGLITFQSIERYHSLNSDTTTREDVCEIISGELQITDEENCDFFREITFEYLQLPQSETWLADDRGLEQMSGFFNLATWSKTFDLILIQRYCPALYEEEFRNHPLGAALVTLDKLKFSRTSS